MLKAIIKVLICITGGFYAAGCIGTAAGCVMRFLRLTRSPSLTKEEINSLAKPLKSAITAGCIGAFLVVALIAVAVRW